MERCSWCGSDALYVKYHDEEWGTPIHNEQKHFEFLLLETMQAGLSWITILRKRENYRSAFAQFDVQKVAQFTINDLDTLMLNEGIIRNRRKIEAAVKNAHAFIAVQQEFGSFDAYIWSFTNNKPVVNKWNNIKEVPAKTELSDIISKDMKKRGFAFVGSVTIYAHLQAIGVINDHVESCFRYKQLV